MYLAQDRDQWWVFVNTEMNLWAPQKAGNFLTRWVTINFSRMTLLHGVCCSPPKWSEFPWKPPMLTLIFTYSWIKVQSGKWNLQTPEPVAFKSLMDIGLPHSIIFQQVDYDLIKQMKVQAVLNRLETAWGVVTTWRPVNWSGSFMFILVSFHQNSTMISGHKLKNMVHEGDKPEVFFLLTI